MMSLGVFSWWSALCVVGALNIVAWSGSAMQLARRRDGIPPDVLTARRLQLLLSAVYVFGCAFRSAVPVFDVPRLCLVDSWVSRVIIGRSVATVAELCFVGQWALLLYASARTSGSRVGRVVALGLVPLIAIAECCSWYSVLTTSNFGHFVEESIWALCGLLLVLSLAGVLLRSPPARRPLLYACCVAGAAYVAFMVLVDIPMYWSRWLADEASGRQYLSIAQGLHDVSGRWVVSYRWQDWKSEMPWMSLYFSVAVWISISLVRVPVAGSSPVRRERRALRPANAC